MRFIRPGCVFLDKTVQLCWACAHCSLSLLFSANRWNLTIKSTLMLEELWMLFSSPQIQWLSKLPHPVCQLNNALLLTVLGVFFLRCIMQESKDCCGMKTPVDCWHQQSCHGQYYSKIKFSLLQWSTWTFLEAAPPLYLHDVMHFTATPTGRLDRSLISIYTCVLNKSAQWVYFF